MDDFPNVHVSELRRASLVLQIDVVGGRLLTIRGTSGSPHAPDSRFAQVEDRRAVEIGSSRSSRQHTDGPAPGSCSALSAIPTLAARGSISRAAHLGLVWWARGGHVDGGAGVVAAGCVPANIGCSASAAVAACPPRTTIATRTTESGGKPRALDGHGSRTNEQGHGAAP